MASDLFLRGSAIFSDDRSCRREIRRWWTPEPRRWAAWLMTNPSNAGEERNDPTALRATAFSKAWGYDGWIGVNLIPFISSTMPAMWKWFDWESNGPDYWARDQLDANVTHIEHVGRQAAIRIVAFGAGAPLRCPEWVEHCLEQFKQPSDLDGGTALYCIGKTQAGHPKHPLARGKHRVAADVKPVLWGT